MASQKHNRQKHFFPPVQYAHFPIKSLSLQEQDELLANGYFRNGLNLYSSLGRYVSGSWRPNLMLRIPLESFVWKKRSRKIMRRNDRHFEVKVELLRPRDEVEDLWYLFKKKIHKWESIGRVTDYLLRGLPADNFNTHELSVYHEGKLVAFSIFDMGANSIASLEAAYHPDFRQHSLGYYTMLKELEFAMEKKLSFYYPGFYPKGLSMFEYKLRPGGVEFFRLKENKWLTWESVNEEDWLAETVESRLFLLKTFLEQKGLQCQFLRQFHANVPSNVRKVGDHQIFLELIKRNGNEKCQRIKIGFDILLEKYEVFIQNMVLDNSDPLHNSDSLRFLPSGPYAHIISSKKMDKIFEVLSLNNIDWK